MYVRAEKKKHTQNDDDNNNKKLNELSNNNIKNTNTTPSPVYSELKMYMTPIGIDSYRNAHHISHKYNFFFTFIHRPKANHIHFINATQTRYELC